MDLSELTVMIIIFSGIMIFFLVPFNKYQCKEIQQRRTFLIIFKDSLLQITFHKKALLAFLLVSFLLAAIWFGYEQEEYHFNAPSGYPLISTHSEAVLAICAFLGYTIILYLLLALWISLNILKKGRSKL
ncbi:hypothetical protein ACIQXF_03760 [Lysinibacillus sp. NPDC097231]|uniref:hypothetical protein n=1 Tax=Lysinibacillus sp. NPDC097231 TaxID=3364142 RepID=UPI0037F8BCFD